MRKKENVAHTVPHSLGEIGVTRRRVVPVLPVFNVDHAAMRALLLPVSFGNPAEKRASRRA